MRIGIRRFQPISIRYSMISSLGQVHQTGTTRSTGVGHNFYWFLAISLPIVVHLWVVYRLAVNIPYIDDYTFLVDCINWQLHGLTLTDYLSRLFHPHGEHVILFARLTALLDYRIEGSLNFRTLFFVGNLTFIGSVYILFRLAQRGGLQPIHFLPVVLLLFQPQFYENTTTWAICALQHLPALFFAFWAFEVMGRPSRRAFLLSLPLAFMSVFSNGNGLIVLFVGLLIVLMSGSRKRLLVWLAFTIISVGLYVYVHQLNHSPGLESNLKHPLRVMAGFFLVAGSIGLLFTRSLGVLVAVGACSVAFVGLLIGQVLVQYLQTDKNSFSAWFRQIQSSWSTKGSFWLLVACYLYVLITVLTVAFARSLGWYQSLLLPRFLWFAAMGMAVGYLLALLWLKPQNRLSASCVALVLSLVVYGSSYWYNLSEVQNVRQLLRSDTQDWREHNVLVSLPNFTSQHDHFYSDILQAAVDKGVYHLPASPLESALSKPVWLPPASGPMVQDSSFTMGERRIHCLVIRNGLPPSHALDTREVYLLARSGQHTFMWPVNRSPTKLTYYLQTGVSDWQPDVVWLFTDQLPRSGYQLSLAWLEKGQWFMRPSRQIMTMGEG